MADTNSKININTADAAELELIKGVGETLGKAIVEYREDNGPFKSLDDLVKVGGVGRKKLSALRDQICIENQLEDLSLSEHEEMEHDGSTNYNSSEVNSQFRESAKYMLDILEPIVKSTLRPQVPQFNYRYSNKGVVRIASWNVERFDEEKANNPGVKEVICMTILENGFGLIAVQELADEKALHVEQLKDRLKQQILTICEELNNPTLSNVRKLSRSQSVWKCIVSDATGRMYRSNEYNGFLYDSSQGITLHNSALLQKPKKAPKPFTRKPFIGTFKIKNFDCIIVSVHLKATGLNNEDLDRLQAEIDRVPAIYEAVEEEYPGERDIMIVGDFNLNPQKEDFDILREKGYGNCIPLGKFTNISNSNPEGSESYDHIWITSSTKKVFSGRSDVVREGLRNAFIPKGWSWGGVVSDHCPIWTEIYTGQDYDEANLKEDTDFTFDG